MLWDNYDVGAGASVTRVCWDAISYLFGARLHKTASRTFHSPVMCVFLSTLKGTGKLKTTQPPTTTVTLVLGGLELLDNRIKITSQWSASRVSAPPRCADKVRWTCDVYTCHGRALTIQLATALVNASLKVSYAFLVLWSDCDLISYKSL